MRLDTNDINFEPRRSQIDKAAQTLADLGLTHENLVVVNADLQVTNRSKAFCNAFPRRSFNIGIAEQNMVSFAAGLAHEGFVPYCFTMAPFMTMRSCEQVRTDVCYGELPVRFIGNAAGYASGVSGATHCALEDVAIMGSFGGMTICEGADLDQVCRILKASADYKGPLYLRMGTEYAKSIYPDDVKFEIGKAMIAREGNDGAFITAGVTVGFALEAAARIKEETGAEIRVVDYATIKPFDKEAAVAAAKTGRVVVAHDHNKTCGLGLYAAGAIVESGTTCKFEVLGAPDKYVPLATTPFLYKINEYDVDGLVKHMKAML